MQHKQAVLAHSVPNKYGAEIYYALLDKPSRERYWIRHPVNKKYWKMKDIPDQMEALSQELQRKGYAVDVVDIKEYQVNIGRRVSDGRTDG